MKGTYLLAIDVEERTTIEIGALGPVTFVPGLYGYVGSAFGPGGLGRVDRHREVARGDRSTRHWHVDYLLGHPVSTIAAVVTFPAENRECELAGSLPGEPVPGFGASDCTCGSHLLAVGEECDDALEAALDAGGVSERCDAPDPVGDSDR